MTVDYLGKQGTHWVCWMPLLRSTKENAFIVRSDFENFGPFIDTDLAPPKNSSGAKLFRENDVIFIDHVLNLVLRLSLLCLRYEVAIALFLAGIQFSRLPRVLVCFLVVLDLLFAFVVPSCRIVDSASLFILYVHDHEHDRLGFGMLTVETAVFDYICWFSSSRGRKGQSYPIE